MIIKRDGNQENFNKNKIFSAIKRAFLSISSEDHDDDIKKITDELAETISTSEKTMSVEEIQDMVEIKLMETKHFAVAKSYIQYRSERNKSRNTINKFKEHISNEKIIKILSDVAGNFTEEVYSLELLYQKFFSFTTSNMSTKEKEGYLVSAAVELTSQEAPRWENISARLYFSQIESGIDNYWDNINISGYYNKLIYLDNKGLLGKYILKNYNKEEIEELENYMDESRNLLFNYSGLDLVYKRYLIRTNNNFPVEKPQEMFMGIAMHLSIPEKENKVAWAKKIYDITSRLQVTLATPTMSNARKPFHQLSSCFIDTVPDSLDGIYRSIDNFAQVSKFGGGMGLYFGKVRAIGSDIRGFKGAAGGVIRWIKLANDTAVAVDQLGVRQGSVAVYLDIWHKDIPEFLQLRTNSGDDRMKSHDVFPAITYPDYFWEQVENNLEGDWHMICPHEVKSIKGYSLEDYYGEQWKEKYLDCVADENVPKRTIKVIDLVRLIIKSSTETGTPFTFNRDLVNEANPNAHKGMIYSSNLCTEIAQNMSGIETVSTEIVKDENGDDIVVNKTKAGDFVVCNLASLVLGNINVSEREKLKEIVFTIIRALDNVIELNHFPLPYAKITNQKYRSIGLGISGYHHMLAKNKINWESDEHLEFVDELLEDINYYAISASNSISKEKGSYEYFEGSDWQTGKYFDKRRYTSKRWDELKKSVSENGLRNGYLLAVAPTSSTSIIAGTTASVDPVMNRYFLEEKKNSIVPRVAPDLNTETFWYYKNAYLVDQEWTLKAAGIRGRHIDQAQSTNLYITTDFTMRQVLNLYLSAWKNGVKTIYYMRSKSLDIDECESCSA